MENQTSETMPRPNVRLVLIEWKDSRQPTNSWAHIAGMGNQRCCDCVSVGFLIQDDEEVKVLAPNIADMDENMQATGVITIPAAAVTAIKPLVETTCSVSSQS